MCLWSCFIAAGEKQVHRALMFCSVEEISYEERLVTTTVRPVYMVKQNCVITLFRLWTEDYTRMLHNYKMLIFIYRKSILRLE
jgi:hypothetical protein